MPGLIVTNSQLQRSAEEMAAEKNIQLN
jgi:hypothetical protein